MYNPQKQINVMKKNILIAIAAAMLTAGTTFCHAQTQQKQQTEQQQEPVYEQDKWTSGPSSRAAWRSSCSL